jgi:hypothetical protein
VGGEEGGHYVCVFGGICCGVVLGFVGGGLRDKRIEV